MTEHRIGVSLMQTLVSMNNRKYNDTFKENDVINGFIFVRFDGLYRRDTAAIFKCKHCLKEFRSPIHPIVKGMNKSCGCQQYANPHSLIHGYARPGKIIPEYRIWYAIKERCNNPNSKAYPDYGMRGIAICEKWEHDFVAFISDVGRRPSKEYTLDRIDNDGNYEPGNVRWATRIEQANNKRTSILVTYKGQTKPLPVWCRELGIRYTLIKDRLWHKWPIERAFETPALPTGLNYKYYKKPSNKFISHFFGYIQ
jgi:hypothetical protein